MAVIHPAIGRDSRQNPDGWHTHPVQLSAGTASSTFCLAQAGVSAAALDVAASFLIVADAGCPELAPGVRLGVPVLDAQAL